MIWFTLALFAVSFVLTALLAPKPEFEDARADDLDPDNFPKASEASPVPLLLGCAKIKGPNTLWYGNYQTIPITERVKTGLFSKTTVVKGYDYYLSIDLGLCLGPAELKQIFIDSEPVDPGLTEARTESFEYAGEDTNGGELFVGSTSNTYTPPMFIRPQYGAGPGGNGIVEYTTESLGLSESQLDAEVLTLNYSYFIQGASTTGFDDTLNAYADVLFYDAPSGGSTLTSPDGVNAQSIFLTMDAPNGSFGPLTEVPITCRIPAGTRRIRFTGHWTINTIIFSNCNVQDPSFSITGLGYDYNSASFSIYEPNLYGGPENGGGHIGNGNYYPGDFVQLQNSHLQATFGTNVPAYRGTAHLMLPNNYIGETASLRKMEFLMGSVSNNLESAYAGEAFEGSVDINPAEAIYEICVNTWRGLGIDPSRLNLASFQTAADTLIAEQHGCSVVVSTPKQGKDVIREILRQIDGVLAENSAGEVELKLIRDDYVAGSLTIYDEDDILEVRNYNRISWHDVKSQVKVKFPTRDKDTDRTAIAQNMATMNMIGEIRTSEISFPFCYDANLANQLAHRELSRLSVPLINLSVTMNRAGYQLVVGDVIKISWPELGISELICRVQKVDTGDLEDNRVNVELTQDIFAVATTVMADPVDTGWVSDRPVPQTIPNHAVVEMPYFYGSRLEYPVEDGEGNVLWMAEQPQNASTGFTVRSGTATTVYDYTDPQNTVYQTTGDLMGFYGRLEGFTTGTDATGITIDGIAGPDPVTATTAEVRTGETGIIYIGGEWMGYEGVTDNMDGTWTLANIRRGLLGSQPLDHADNSKVYFFATDFLGSGALAGGLVEDGTVYYKILDQIAGELRGENDETEQSLALSDIADRPLRPRNMQFDSSRATVPHDFASDPDVSVSWVASNRTEDEVTFEDDAAETPDQTETYDVEVWIDSVDESATYGATSQSSPYALDLTGAEGSDVEIRVYSRRTVGDLKSSAYYAFYTGTLDSIELLSGDMQSGTTDKILVSGDEQDLVSDGIKLSGDAG